MKTTDSTWGRRILYLFQPEDSTESLVEDPQRGGLPKDCTPTEFGAGLGALKAALWICAGFILAVGLAQLH
ncbi:hypothetical protein SAMN02745216_01817 [Desulfatibacillum alkenivorans DSM 16219]|jgi:hypothetical protein|uniref:Uncharacterized protein n=1 Tax=Desulfatibacillum alkenivorans DSM 16219 TaxID=1121393 RepID=A0A1M6JZH1_9BACT|nr:hypothetical protein [Desulfatibacillum alkenivorans]SHJ51982.1 hypothetical protein SAMN02745216_01817 [Desulfatibacillum alkenivorans DSM 16219]